MKVGRPSDYSPKVLEVYKEYMEFAVPENQEIPTIEGLALKIGVSRRALYRWAKKHKEFRHTLRELKMKQKEALTKIGVFGGKEINSNIVMLLLKVNHAMIEKAALDVTSGGKPTPILGYVSKNHSNRKAEQTNKED